MNILLFGDIGKMILSTGIAQESSCTRQGELLTRQVTKRAVMRYILRQEIVR